MVKRTKALLRAPVAWAVNLVLRASGRRTGVAILYHRVEDLDPSSTGNRLALSLEKRDFAAQVRHLNRRYRVVPASQLLAAVRTRKRWERLPVAITFDDDSPTHVQNAAPILKQVGAPATFFVCGASLESPYSFWWERLERALDRGTLDESRLQEMVPATAPARYLEGVSGVHVIAKHIEFLPPADRDALAEQLGKLAGPDPADAGLTSAQVRSLAGDGFEIGFHTLRHDNLLVLDDEQLDAAMRDGRESLGLLVGGRIDVISYPGGRWNRHAVAAARSAGFQFGFTTEIEPVDPETDPLQIGRYDATGSPTLGNFALNVARILRRRNRA